MKGDLGNIYSEKVMAAALTVYFLDLSFAAGESEDKTVNYMNIYYGSAIALVTIFGTLLILKRDM